MSGLAPTRNLPSALKPSDLVAVWILKTHRKDVFGLVHPGRDVQSCDDRNMRYHRGVARELQSAPESAL